MMTNELEIYLEFLKDPNFKGVIGNAMDQVLYVNQQTFPKSIFQISKDYLYYHQYGIYFQKDSFLVDQVNEVIQSVASNGLLNQWTKQSINEKYLKSPALDKEPKQLQLDQLMGGLFLYIAGLCVSIFIFALENIRNVYHKP